MGSECWGEEWDSEKEAWGEAERAASSASSRDVIREVRSARSSSDCRSSSCVATRYLRSISFSYFSLSDMTGTNDKSEVECWHR